MQVDLGFGTFDLAKKGFCRATLRISHDFEIDVYNLHAAAGEPLLGKFLKGFKNDPVETAKLRRIQFAQLTQAIKEHSQGKAVIVLGDTNLHWMDSTSPSYSIDKKTFNDFLRENHLKSACQELGICEKPGWTSSWPLPHGAEIDQIMFRGNDQYDLKVIDFYQLDYDISDHEPIVALLMWRKDLGETKVLTGLKIEGSDSITEAASEKYVCLKEYDDGTTEAVDATWTIDRGDAHAYLNPVSGVLSAHAVDEDKTVTIRCTYEEPAKSLTATKDVQIKETGELYSLEIQGPDRVADTATGTYACIVHWSDGSSEPEEATWTVTEGQAYASIEYAEYPKVKLVPKQQLAQEQTVTIRCEFIWAQEKKATTKVVVIYPS